MLFNMVCQPLQRRQPAGVQSVCCDVSLFWVRRRKALLPQNVRAEEGEGLTSLCR